MRGAVQHLRTETMTPRILHFERIDSTNLEARRLVEQGERRALWIRADEQTGGRGRLGRSWVSEPGNLYATYLFPISAGVETASQVSFVAALAVHDLALELLPNVSARIKWPNDVLINGAKFCGLLAEVVAPQMIALGCGINVAHAPAGTPYPVTALGQHGSLPPLDTIFQELHTKLQIRLKMWDEGRGFARIRDDWTARAAGLNSETQATIGDKQHTGLFRGLAADGALILELPDTTQHHIHSGEVRFAAIEAMRNAQEKT